MTRAISELPVPFAVGPRRWVVVLVLLAGAVLLVGHSLYFGFVCDDAFISFRYADHLVRHGELTFNPGQRVEGYTNFLWTLLIAGGLAAGLEATTWSLLLGLVCSVTTLLVVYRFGATLDALAGSDERETGRWRLVTPMLLAALPAFACWTSGGLETALFTLLVTAAVWRYWAEARAEGGRPWSGLLFGLACLTRPEGALFLGLTLLHRVVDRRLRLGRWRPQRRDWLWLGLALLIVVPHEAWRVIYYGQWVPNTYYAKVAGVDHQGRGWLYLWSFLRDYKLWIVLLLLVVPRRRPGRAAVASLYLHVAVLAVVLAAHVVNAGGDFMAMHRFFVPVLPLLVLLFADELRNLHRLLVAVRAGWGSGPAAVHVVEVVAALGATVYLGSLSHAGLQRSSAQGVDQIAYLRQFTRENAAIGRWLAEHAPPDARIATTAAGAIPYYSRLRAFDMHGLTEPAVHRDRSAPRPRPGHTRVAPDEQVAAWGPTHVIGHPRVYPHDEGRPGAERAFWEARGYRWRVIELPDIDRWWGFFENLSPSEPNDR